MTGLATVASLAFGGGVPFQLTAAEPGAVGQRISTRPLPGLPMQQSPAAQGAEAGGQLNIYAGPRFVPPDEVATMPYLPPISLPGPAPRRRRLYPRLRLPRPPAFLVAVLAVQALMSLRLIWSNTAFADEALYLWAGRLELNHWFGGTPIPRSVVPFPVYFSGAPVIYPPLGAAVNSYAGLAGARLLSLAFMLGATSLLYSTARKLFGSVAAMAAAGVFACFGPTQFLGAFATYDAMALFLLALSAWLVTRSPRRAGELLLVASALTLALADATKYATTLWDPVVIVLAAACAGTGRWWRAGLRAARLTAYTAAPLAGAAFWLGGKPYLHGIMTTTLQRQVTATPSPTLSVLGDSFSLLWLLVPLALVAAGVSFAEGPRARVICVTLAAAVLLAPLHQAQIHTIVSLHKHVDFGAWFGCIPAGYLLARGVAVCGSKGWRIVLSAIAVIAFAGATQTDSLYIDGWPAMAKADTALSGLLPRTRCPCLIFADNVVEYYLFKEYSASKYRTTWGAYFFQYRDPVTGRELTGDAAYLQAIRHHYFALIEIDPGEYLPLYRSVSRALMNSPSYELAATFPVTHLRQDRIEIWRYQRPPPSDAWTNANKLQEQRWLDHRRRRPRPRGTYYAPYP